MSKFTIKDAKKMVKAWESLPEGHHNARMIEMWLIGDMEPVINQFRMKIKEHDKSKF